MTAVQPPPAAPVGHDHRRPGVHVPTWVGVLVVGLVLAVGAFVVGFAIADRRDRHGATGPFGGRMGAGHPGARFVGLLFVLAIVTLVVLGIVWAVRALSHRPAATSWSSPRPGSSVSGGAAAATGAVSSTATAEHILAERLARGEIDADDYRARLDALRR